MRGLLALLVLFCTLSLHAISDTILLQRAQKNLKSQNKSDVFKAYNDYKTLYLRSVMEQNNKLKIEALKGIVNSGNRLHIDVSAYQEELRNSTKTTYKKPTPKPNKKPKKAKKIKLKATNKLKAIYWRDGRLVLRFKHRLKKHQVNYFKLYDAKKNEYKYIFDIEASMMTKAQSLTKPGIQSIKIAQFKPNILRIVFKNDSVVRVRFKFDGNELVINAQPTKKTTRTPPQKKQKKIKQPVVVPKIDTAKPIGKKTIVIDPGHGGKDPGAVGYRRYREKVIVLQIGKYLRDYLKKRGYKVYMTRDRDRFIKLSKRTKYANKKKADFFISIHANAASKNKKKARGIETYFLSPSRSERAEKVAAMENKADIDEMSIYGKKSFLMFLNNHKIVASNKLAIDLQQGMLLELRKHYKGVVDGGVREGPFWVLVGAQMPAVLIEVGFITHPTEARRLVNRTYQKRLAKGIADGIERYFIKNR